MTEYAIITNTSVSEEGQSFERRADRAVSRRGRGVGATLVAMLLVAAHLVFLLTFFEPAISTPDANGYFAQARLLANEHQTYFESESPLQYVPPHWLSMDGIRYYSKYPPGLPVLAALAYSVFGPKAALLVNPVMASLTLLALFLLCRLWFGAGWGLLAAVLMAFNPITNQQALFAFAHTAVAFFLVWGLYFVSRWARDRRLWAVFLAGLFFGAIPSVRYAEVLFCFAFVIFMLLHLRSEKRLWRTLAAASSGLALPILALCIRNHFAFGAFWKTGYSLTHEQTGFGWNYFVEHAVPYLEQLLGRGSGMLFGLGVVGLAAMCASREGWKRGVLLALIAIPATLLYMAYYWSADGMSMRFLAPTLFVYAIASTSLLFELTAVRRAMALAGSVVLLAVTACWGLPQSIESLGQLERDNAALAEITQVIKDNVTRGSVVIADSHVQQQLDFLGDWKLVDETALRRRPAAEGPDLLDDGMVHEPSPRPPSRSLARYEDLRGDARLEAMVDDIFRWAGNGQSVYWLVREDDRTTLVERIGESDLVQTIARIELAQQATRETGPAKRRAVRRRSPPGRPPAGPGGGAFAGRRPPGGHFPGMGGPGGPGRPLQTDKPWLLIKWTRRT